MMLKIGISNRGRFVNMRQAQRGFMLVEIMISTCLLALGVVFIYQALLTSLSAYEYCAHFVEAAPWANEQIARAQLNLSLSDSLQDIASQGEFVLDNKPYTWRLTPFLIEKTAFAKLYRVHLEVHWQEAGKSAAITRDVYALHEKKFL